MNPEIPNDVVKEKKVLSPERRAQLSKALEKANAARKANVDVKKKEKDLQKKVYEEAIKETERKNKLAEQKLAKMTSKASGKKKVFEGEELVAPEFSSGEDEPESSVPVKTIKLSRKKKVMIEYSDSDSDVDEHKIKQAFRSLKKGKSVAPEMTPEEYQETLLRARYGTAVKQIVQKNVEDEEKTLKYYHGSSGDRW